KLIPPLQLKCNEASVRRPDRESGTRSAIERQARSNPARQIIDPDTRRYIIPQLSRHALLIGRQFECRTNARRLAGRGASHPRMIEPREHPACVSISTVEYQ